MAPVYAETFSYFSSGHYEGQGEVEDSDNFMNQSITMEDSLMNQSIFIDTPHGLWEYSCPSAVARRLEWARRASV